MSKETREILILDYNPRNAQLLEQYLHTQNYETTSATTLDALRKILVEGIDSRHPLSAIIDIARLEWSIRGPIEDLRARGISLPIISVGNEDRSIMQQEGAKRGTAGVLTKPLIMKDLLRVIKTLNHYHEMNSTD